MTMKTEIPYTEHLPWTDLRRRVADIANNMEAADGAYMAQFIHDLRKAVIDACEA